MSEHFEFLDRYLLVDELANSWNKFEDFEKFEKKHGQNIRENVAKLQKYTLSFHLRFWHLN